jgi:hypothetical protein
LNQIGTCSVQLELTGMRRFSGQQPLSPPSQHHPHRPQTLTSLTHQAEIQTALRKPENAVPFRIPCRCGATYMLKSKPSRDRVKCRKCGEPIRIPNRKPQRKTAEPAHPESKHSGFPIFPVVVVLALLIGGGIAATQVDFRVLLGGKNGDSSETGPTGGGVPGFTEHTDELPEIVDINLVGTFPDWRPYTIVIRTTSPHSLPRNADDGEALPSEQIGDRVVFALPNDLAMFLPDTTTIVLGTQGAVRVVAKAETSLPQFDWIRFSEFDFVKAPKQPSIRGEEGPSGTAVSFGSNTEIVQSPVTKLLQMPSAGKARQLAGLLDKADEKNRERGIPVVHSRKRFGAVLEQTGPDQLKANPHELRLLAGRRLREQLSGKPGPDARVLASRPQKRGPAGQSNRQPAFATRTWPSENGLGAV